MGEGDNSDNHLIRIANAKIDVHRIFIKFAMEYLGVPREKIRFWVLLYPDLVPQKCSLKWSKALHVPLSQFHKHQVIEGRSAKRTLHDGVGNTLIGDKVAKRKLLKWIYLFKNSL